LKVNYLREKIGSSQGTKGRAREGNVSTVNVSEKKGRGTGLVLLSTSTSAADHRGKRGEHTRNQMDIPNTKSKKSTLRLRPRGGETMNSLEVHAEKGEEGTIRGIGKKTLHMLEHACKSLETTHGTESYLRGGLT